MSLVNLNSVFDVNNDSTVDLVAVLTISAPPPSSSSSILIAICGRSGKLMWQMTLNSSCTQTELVALIDQLNFNSPCLPNKSPGFFLRYIFKILLNHRYNCLYSSLIVNLLAPPSQQNNVMDLSNFKPAEPFLAENIKYQRREARSLDPLCNNYIKCCLLSFPLEILLIIYYFLLCSFNKQISLIKGWKILVFLLQSTVPLRLPCWRNFTFNVYKTRLFSRQQ